MRIVFVVPARGGDREVPYLNIKRLGGLPLIAHTLVEASRSEFPHFLVVSTDDDDVARVAEEYGAEAPFRRPSTLATDSTTLHAIVKHAVEFVENREGFTFDIVVALQATSPFRTGRQIDEAIRQLIEKKLDSVISVKELRSLTWRSRGGKLEPVHERAGRREELEPLYQEDGAIRVLSRHVLDSDERLGTKIGHIVMDRMSALTVHDIYDFWLAERLENMPRVLFRVDGGAEMGMGHVYRSLAAAKAFKNVSRTADVCFLMRADRPEGIRHVSREGYQVRVLHEEASELPAIRDYSPNLIVNDLPFVNDEYLRSLAKLGASTVNFVDSLADIETPHGMAAIIVAALAEEQVEHAGPDFAILREAFQQRSATVSPQGRLVVLSFGGSDPQKLTLKSLSALAALAAARPGVEVVAVLGPAFGHLPELNERIKSLSYQPRILNHVDHMADILVDADVVLCSGGMTVFEIAALGRPGIVLCQNAKEDERMQRFAREGSIIHLGLGTEVGEDVIRETTRELLDDTEQRRRMSEAGAALVDGKGASRVAAVMRGESRRGPANGGRRE
jgi:spore coat polysaccharide biosynthesis predicted glycosyltransferase SpsG/CMP-N-acetylneuraminic acid synthetase